MSGKYWDRTWSAVDGCSKKRGEKGACANCWLEATAKRFPRGFAEGVVDSDGHWTGKVVPRWDRLALPIPKRKPKRRYMYAVWSDLFHEKVPEDFIKMVLYVCALTLDRDYFICTKRIDRAARILNRYVNHGDFWGDSWARRIMKDETAGEIFRTVITPKLSLSNVWFGTTVEDQETLDERLPYLLQVPGKRFLSIEPLLGPVDLGNPKKADTAHGDYTMRIGRGLSGIHQVILGGESGPGARPMNVEWVRAVRDQCAAAGVPFFFKQWGTAYRQRDLYDSTSEVSVKRMAILDGKVHDKLAWRDRHGM